MKPSPMKLRVLSSLAAALLLSGGSAFAQRSYAVLSLLGDRLDVVTYQPQVGTLLDNNLHLSLPISDGSLDLIALRASRVALKRSDPQAPVALLAASTPEVFSGQDAMFNGSHVTLPPDIAAAVQDAHATHLLLLTKHHGMASLDAADGHLGSGKIEGLGFYIDNDQRMKNLETGARTRGFVAPFAYIDVTLVDLSTSTIVRRANILKSEVLSPPTQADGQDGAGPWSTLTAAQKVNALGHMLREVLEASVPAVVAIGTGATPSIASR